MGRMKKLIGLLSMTALLTITMSVPAFAAKKITEVSLKVTNEFKIGEGPTSDDVEVTSKSKKYSVGDVEILNETDEWGSDDIPEIEVTLNAESGYYFSITASTVNVNGGTYVSGRKGDNSYSVILKLRLPAMTNQVGEMEEAGWSSKTTAYWKEATNAGTYEVSLYRDGKKTGTTQTVSGTSIDFGSMMQKEGTYDFKVRAVNRIDTSKKSEWFESQSSTYIDTEEAQNNRNKYGSSTSGLTEPGQAAQQTPTVGWQKDNKGWWYRNADGSYPTNNWLYVNGKWYFFDSVGYMVTGWIQWNGKYYYCTPDNGDMLVDTIVPDGSGRRVDSNGAWIQ